MDSYFFKQLLQNEILKNAAAICFCIKILLITSELKQTYLFLARFLNRNSDRKRRWLFLLSFLFSRLNNMTDFNLWLLSSRLRHWPTYFHGFFLIKRFPEKKSVACFHWMPKLFRRVDDFFCCHLWLDIRSRTYLIMGWNYFWRSIHNFQHLLFLEIYRLFFLLQGTLTTVGLLFQTISIIV